MDETTPEPDVCGALCPATGPYGRECCALAKGHDPPHRADRTAWWTEGEKLIVRFAVRPVPQRRAGTGCQRYAMDEQELAELCGAAREAVSALDQAAGIIRREFGVRDPLAPWEEAEAARDRLDRAVRALLEAQDD